MDPPPALWLVADRYFVGSVVGRGGYGMVRRGVDRKTGKQVALKMLSPEAGRDRDAVERMLREQQALVALSGTCAVTAVDLCRLESGAPCLVMEWLEGRDLEQQLSEWEAAGSTQNIELLLSLLPPLTDTLDHAHALGIVHRDIKPANVFLTPAAPGVRLLDFGLARMRSAAPLTAAGMVMGSPSYIAPETWRGNSAEIDGRADLFSLGVIVFRWLTGKLPFSAPDLVGKMLAVTSGPRPSAVSLDATLPPALDGWVARALAVDPRDRFQSGHEFGEALASVLNGKGAPRPATSSVPKPRVLVDAQQTLAAAFRSASELLKRFAQPLPQKREAPVSMPATPEVHRTLQNQAPTGMTEQRAGEAMPTAVDSSEDTGALAAGQRRNTVWLDSNELTPVAKGPQTVWLDSSELAPVASGPRTVWLDSSELTEVPPAPAIETELEPARAGSDETTTHAASLTPRAVTKNKRRMQDRSRRAKNVAASPTRVTVRKKRGK